MMTFYHHYDLATLEDIMPYELSIYCDLVKEAIKKK